MPSSVVDISVVSPKVSVALGNYHSSDQKLDCKLVSQKIFPIVLTKELNWRLLFYASAVLWFVITSPIFNTKYSLCISYQDHRVSKRLIRNVTLCVYKLSCRKSMSKIHFCYVHFVPKIQIPHGILTQIY